jgi:hypothetical protein
VLERADRRGLDAEHRRGLRRVVSEELCEYECGTLTRGERTQRLVEFK